MNCSLRRALCACLLFAMFGFFVPGSQASPAVGTPRNPSDAFLPLPAVSVEGVLEQVQSDAVVRRHYARYLHLPQYRVASYLRANMVRSHLITGGLYTVYYVRPNGLIYPTLLTVPAGSPVFALRNGAPLLTMNEGDPLTRAQKSARLGVAGSPTLPPLPVPPAPPLQIIVPTQVQTTVVPSLTPPTGADAIPGEATSADSRQAAGKR